MQRLLFFILFTGLGILAYSQTAENLANEFERAKKISLSYLDAMPPDKYSFRPKKSMRTFSEQMLHASQGTFNMVANATGAEPKYADRNLEQDSTLQSAAEVKRIVAESFDFAIEAIKALDNEKMNEIVKAGPFEVTRFGWLFKASEHIAHHRGQAAVYLRLAGIVPPRYQLF